MAPAPTNAGAGGTQSAPPFDSSRYLSKLARGFPPSSIRSLFPLEKVPGMISFLAGKPNQETFPLASLSFTLQPDPSNPGEPVRVDVAKEDLEMCLQYGATSGFPALNAWLTSFTSKMHHRPLEDATDPWRLSIGSGSQDLLHKTFQALLDPGDCIIAESPCYSGVLPSITAFGGQIVPVECDEQGLSPTHLARVLENWDTAPETKGKPRPKAIYTCPSGANPGGTTASEQRKREVLALARQHDVLILEDDPYYYLVFTGLGEDPVTRPRPKSFFALEAEGREQWGTGRVLRFESFSKIIGAGLRVGYVSGPPTLLNAIDTFTASYNLQPNGPAQALTHALLTHWGPSGFLQHVDRVSAFYKQRRDAFEAVVHHVLGGDKPVARWVTPVAGMFLWLQLLLPSTPDAPQGDSLALVAGKARERGFLGVPGVDFQPGTKVSPYVRVSFSLVPLDQVEPGFQRLRDAIAEVWAEAGQPL